VSVRDAVLVAFGKVDHHVHATGPKKCGVKMIFRRRGVGGPD
jgi:hypothetical protein